MPAFTWKDVTEHPRFQEADERRRQEIQLRYFQEVVAPRLPEDRYEAMRDEFFERTMPDTVVEQPGLIRRTMDALNEREQAGVQAYREQTEALSRPFGESGFVTGQAKRIASSPAPSLEGSKAFESGSVTGGGDKRLQPTEEQATDGETFIGDLSALRQEARRNRLSAIDSGEVERTLGDEFSTGLSSASRGVQMGYYGSRAMATDDDQERTEYLREYARLRELSAEDRPSTGEFTDINWSPRRGAEWLSFAAGTLLPTYGAIIAGGIAGGKTGATAGSVAGPKGAAVGGVGGSIMGSFSVGVGLYAGNLYAEAMLDGFDHESARSASLRWGSAASAVSIVGPLTFMSVVSGALGRDYVRSRTRNAMIGAGIGATGEGAAEAAAEYFTVMAEDEIRGETTPWEEVRERMLNAQAIGSVGGGAMGVIGGAVQRQGNLDTIIDGFLADADAAFEKGSQAKVAAVLRRLLSESSDLTENQQALLEYIDTGLATRNRPLNQEAAEIQELALEIYQRDDAQNLKRFTELSRKHSQGNLTGREAIELTALLVNSDGVRNLMQSEGQAADQAQQADPSIQPDRSTPDPRPTVQTPTDDKQAAAALSPVDIIASDPATSPSVANAQRSLLTGDGFAFVMDRAQGNDQATGSLKLAQSAYLESLEASDQGRATALRQQAANAYADARAAIDRSERDAARAEAKARAIDQARAESAAQGGDALEQQIAAEQAEAEVDATFDQVEAVDPITPQAPTAPAPVVDQQAPTGEPQAQTVGAEADTGTMTPTRVPVDQIQVDPDAYQFRTAVNERGVDDRMDGIRRWDDLRAGDLVIHERADGSLFVADGHHRLDLARRLGQPSVNAFVLREADGYSVEDARRMAAERNIASGSSTAIDAAKVFRNTEGDPAQVIVERDLPRRSQVVRDGADIARLGDEAFGAVLNDVVSEKDGAAIGRAFDDVDQQLAAIDVFQRIQPQNDNQRALLINEIRQAGFAETQGEQGGLFGGDPTQSLIGERVRVMDRLRQDLVRDRRLFATLNRNARAAEQAGNVIATEANEALSDTAARAVALLERVTTNPEMNARVNEAARRVNEGQPVAEAVAELKEVLLRGPDSEATQQPGTPDAGRRQADGRGQVERGDREVPAGDDARTAPAGEQRLAGDRPLQQPEGLAFKADGTPFASEATAMRSGVARRARAQGKTVEAVAVEGGFAVRVEPDPPQAQPGEQTTEAPAEAGVSRSGQQPQAVSDAQTQGARAADPATRRQINQINRIVTVENRDGLSTYTGENATVSIDPDPDGGASIEITQTRTRRRGRALEHRESQSRVQYSTIRDQISEEARSEIDAAIAAEQDDAQDSLTLETQTEESLAADQQAQDQQQAEQTALEREQEQRAQADRERDNFGLTGSDLPADQAAARGQSSLFRRGDSPTRAAERRDGIIEALRDSPELSGVTVGLTADNLPALAQSRLLALGIDPLTIRGANINGVSYVVAANVDSVAEGIRVALHEEVGHRGVREVLGERLDGAMRRIYATFPRNHAIWRQVRSLNDHIDLGTNAGRMEFAEEIVANLAELNPQVTAWQRFVARVRDILRQMFPEVAWTENDVIALIQRSRTHLQRQAARRPGSSVRFSVARALDHAKSKAQQARITSEEQFFTDFWPKALRATGLRRQPTPRNVRRGVRQAITDMEGWLRDNPRFMDYYSADMAATREVLDGIFGAVTDEQFQLFQAYLGLTSPSTPLKSNIGDAMNALRLFLDEGSLGRVEMGLSPKGNPVVASSPFTFSSTTGANKARALKVLDTVIEQQGGIQQALDYLQEGVTTRELHQFNRAMGYKGAVGDIGSIRSLVMEATGQDQQIPRMFIFGKKVGAYTLNTMGDSRYTTIDIWESRFIRSYFDGMFEQGTGLPVNRAEHDFFSAFNSAFKDEMQARFGQEFEASALQAMRWFYILNAAREAGYANARTESTISEYAQQVAAERFGANDQGGRGRGAQEDAGPGQEAQGLADGTFVLDQSAEPDVRFSVGRGRVSPGQMSFDFESLEALSNADPYQSAETRPDTTETQRDAGRSALRDLFRQLTRRYRRRTGGEDSGAEISVLGARIFKNFAEGRPNQIVGQRVTSPADLAAVAQVYRDPRFETVRFILMRGDEVVGETAVTSRLPAAVQVGDDAESMLTDAMREAGADSYYMMHNHPSGRSNPSTMDVQFTQRIAGNVEGFLSHVVIDTNEFSVIGRDGDFRRFLGRPLGSTDFASNPETPHALLGETISSPDALAGIAKRLQGEGDQPALISTNSRGEITLATLVPVEYLDYVADNMDDATVAAEAAAAIRRIMRASGSGGYNFIVVPPGLRGPARYDRLMKTGAIMDVIDGDGRSRSSHVRSRDVPPWERFARPMRVAEPRFSIAPPVESQAFRDWFGDSPNVNDDGSPIIFHHGGSSAFSRTTDGRFGGGIFVREGRPSGYGETQHALYLRSPILELSELRSELSEDAGQDALAAELSSADQDTLSAVAEALSADEHYPQDRAVWDAIGAIDESDAAVEIQSLRGRVAKRLGYEAVRQPDEFDGETVMVLENSAIKSATGNVGTFDPDNPDIRFSISPDEVLPFEAPITPVNETENKKQDSLASAFQRAGEFIAPPILVYRDGNDALIALTGSHRIAAAKDAEVDIPVIYTKDGLDDFVADDGRTITDVWGFGDEDVARFLREFGDDRAARVMDAEVDTNEQPFTGGEDSIRFSLSEPPSGRSDQPDSRLDYEFVNGQWVDGMFGDAVSAEDATVAINEQIGAVSEIVENRSPQADQAAQDLAPQLRHALENGLPVDEVGARRIMQHADQVAPQQAEQASPFTPEQRQQLSLLAQELDFAERERAMLDMDTLDGRREARALDQEIESLRDELTAITNPDTRFSLSEAPEPSAASASLAELQRNLNDQHEGLRLFITHRNGVATIHRMELPAEQREQGAGTEIMGRLTGWADQNGVTLALTPSADFGGQVGRLREFYGRHGFQPNTGRSRDHAISESIVRRPQGDALFSLGERVDSPTLAQVTEALSGVPALEDAHVLDNANQIPLDTGLHLTLRGRDPRTAIAFYDDNDVLTVVAQNASNADEALRAAVIEKVAHDGLVEVIGDAMDDLASQVYRKILGSKRGRDALQAVRSEYDYLDASIPADRSVLALDAISRLFDQGNPPAFAADAMSDMRNALRDRFGITDANRLALANRLYLDRMQREFGGQRPPSPPGFALDMQEGGGTGTLMDLNSQIISADGELISDVRINSFVSSNPLRTMGQFFTAQSDRLRQTNSRILNALADRIDRYFDQHDARLGMINDIIRAPLKEMRRLGQRRENERLFEQYWRDWDNGRRDQAKQVYDANPTVASMVDAAVEMFHVTGLENQRVKTPNRTGLWVRDENGLRRIGKVRKGAFWPRAIRREVQAVLQDPTSDPVLWGQLLDALVEGGYAKDRQEAGTWLLDKKRGYFNEVVTQDYFAGIEKARGEKLPEVFYDYSLAVVGDYGTKWAMRISQVEQFGQKLTKTEKDSFEEAMSVAADSRTVRYIGQVRDNIYNARNVGGYGLFMSNANMLATGLHLGNWATASQNLTTGTGLNVQMFGSRRVAKAYIDMMRDWSGVQSEGVRLGILGKDVMNLMRDADNSQIGVFAEGDMSGQFAKIAERFSGNRISASEFLREFTQLAMKVGGYHTTEQMIRANAFLAARAQLADALDAWENAPGSAKAKKYERLMVRNRIDVGQLIAEGGNGAETAKYLRLMVNLPQGSYRGDQNPLFADTQVGRFFFKYQKFGIQTSRLFWQQRLRPFIESTQDPNATAAERAGYFMDIVHYVGVGVASGLVNRKVRATLFGMAFVGADWDEILERFRDEDHNLALAWLADNMFHSALSAGSIFGFFGSPLQMMLDWSDQQRMRNPVEPPGFAVIKGLTGLGVRGFEQGGLDARDISDAVLREFSFPRVVDRTVATAGNTLDLDVNRFKRESFRRDQMYVRGAVRRWADITGNEGRSGAPTRFRATENTQGNRRLHDAIMVGNAKQARAIVREELEGLTGDERRNRLQSMRTSMRMRHPLRLAGGPMNQEEQAQFKRWAQQTLPEHRWEVIRTTTDSYDRTMEQAFWRMR